MNKKFLTKNEMINEKYKVQFFISGNNFIQKYKVVDTLGNNYILKIYVSKTIKPRIKNNALVEAEILSHFNHKNLIGFIDEGKLINQKKEFYFIVTSFLSGETLLSKFKREKILNPYFVIPLVIELLESISILHSHPDVLIHNNINMESVYLDYSDNREKPILTNFEYARFLSTPQDSFNINHLNLNYCAPEILNNVFLPNGDLFSIGVLMYHLVVGEPLWNIDYTDLQFPNEKMKETILKKRRESLDLNILKLDNLSDDLLKKVIKKAINQDFNKRFNSAEEFIQALKRKIKINIFEIDESLEPVIKQNKKQKGEGFLQIVGMEDVKNILSNDIIRALHEKERFEKYDIPLPNGMLLYGPPGCGKTFIAEKFAEEVGFNFIKVFSSDIASTYIHGTQEKIGKLFKEAEKNAPTVIFIDEIEGIAPKRGIQNHQSYSSEVNELLLQINNCGERGIFIISASNMPEIIDEALTRAGRIDYKMYIPPPDFEARFGLFKLYLKKKPLDLMIDYKDLALQTENFVCSDIKLIVDKAAREAEKRDIRISQTILTQIINIFQPSVSIDELDKYEKMHQHFTKRYRERQKNKSSHIGFIKE